MTGYGEEAMIEEIEKVVGSGRPGITRKAGGGGGGWRRRRGAERRLGTGMRGKPKRKK